METPSHEQPLRLVVAGGRVPDYPALRDNDLSLDINPRVRPHLCADVRRMPIPCNVFDEVYMEYIPMQAVVSDNFAGIAEAVRVLRPGGTLLIVTGMAAPAAAIAAELRRLTMENIVISPGGPLRISAKRPDAAEALVA